VSVTTSRRILANTGYRALAELGSKAASLVLFVVMARRLGEAGFGVFTFALAFVTLVTALGGFGQDNILTREVARDHSRIGEFFFNTVALKLVVALPVLALALAASWAAGMPTTTLTVIALLGLAVTAELLVMTCFGVFQAFERLGFMPVVLISQRVLTAATGIAILLAGGDVVAVAAVYLAGSLLALVLAFWFVLRRVVRPRVQIEPRRWWPLMATALPVGLAGAFGTVLFRVDTALLALFESDSVVGEYGAAFRLFETTFFLSWSVGTATYPVFARLSSATEPTLTLVYERSLKLLAALTLPLAVGAAVLAEPLVRVLYGDAYAEAATALQLLAPAIMLYPLTHLAANMLIARNRQRAVAISMGVAAGFCVATNLVLIPLYSLNGAAATASLSQLVLAIALLVLARREAPGIGWRRVLSGPVLASVLLAGAAGLLQDSLGAAVAAGAVAYLVSIVVFERLAYPDDARTLSDFVRRRGD
jgi:O-antigen/teichoic acid export membrane protein